MFKFSESSSLKLFGKTIPLLTLNQEEEALTDHATEDCCDRHLLSSSNSFDGVNSNDEYHAQAPWKEQETIEKEFLKDKDKHEDSTSHDMREDLKDTTSAERKTSSLESSKDEEKSETTSSWEKITLKKPDKILPCPRCHSKETKFCYYNNYNVNQPRHLCKNCQRYWTAGGNMRNLPVGSGRRKSKSSSALHYHQILISEAIRVAQASTAAIGIHRNSSCENNNSRVLTFGSGSIPVPSVFNISEKTQINVQNGFQKPKQRIVVEDNHSGESLITASHSLEKEGNASLNQSQGKNYQCFPSKIPLFTGLSWPYPRDSIQSSTAMLPPPTTLSPPGFTVSFHPAPTYWNYSVSPGDVPVAFSPSFSPTAPALGKHSRDENIVNLSPANSEKEKPSGESNKSELGRALNSKTLRIDDPGETLNSSILATLLIKSNKTNSINSGGLFDGFQSKSSDDINHRLDSFLMLRANPAALSRSLNFQENT